MKENKNEKQKRVLAEINQQVRKNKTTFVVFCILRVFVFLAGTLAFFRGNYENVFLCVLSVLLMFAPAIIKRKLQIALPSVLEIIILVFIFCAQILGEIGSFYTRIPHWDTMLHTVNGFLCAAIGFALLDILNRDSKIKLKLSPLFLAIVAFCFSMTIGVLWEFFEFGADVLFQTDMQKDYIVHHISSVMLNPDNLNVPIKVEEITNVSVNGVQLPLDGYLDIGIYDTMKDLFVNFIGAVVFSVIGYYYVKTRGEGKIAKQFIPVIDTDNDSE